MEPNAARRSPRKAPTWARRIMALAALRCSPGTSETTRTHFGAEAWPARCDRPSCWMIGAADHGSSKVKCTLGRWFGKAGSAWSEMPVEPAAEMTATNLRPSLNAAISSRFTDAADTASSPVLASARSDAWRSLLERPVSSATTCAPPSSAMSKGSAACGSSRRSASSSMASRRSRRLCARVVAPKSDGRSLTSARSLSRNFTRASWQEEASAGEASAGVSSSYSARRFAKARAALPPVDWRPTTTAQPRARAHRISAAVVRTLNVRISCMKNVWCTAQKCNILYL
mmetsp:Transcript_28717/g.96742  ORF Transcript_28717/g.96742 Transcript_28717/m.96742 type:complete len:286 (-) Transcript_28717:949-1806(-)